MISILRWFKNRLAKSHISLITVNIHKQNLIHNYQEFSRILERPDICPVLKSNAYGHGLVEVGKIVDELTPPFIVVDAIYEAMNLRSAGIKSKILVIGHTPVDNIRDMDLENVSFLMPSLDYLNELIKLRKKVSIHLKIDTGMSRQGILTEELDTTLDLLEQAPFLTLEGVCTHLADADNQEESEFTAKQIDTWNLCSMKVQGRKPFVKFFHVSATAGFIWKDKIRANVFRLGIGLYGLNSGGAIDKMVTSKPVMEIRTRITQIKKIRKGDGVGYNHTFIAPSDMTIATIPMGYYEGLDRRLSNKGFILIGNSLLPIIGRISMNIATINVTPLGDGNIKPNDEVIVISTNKQDKNSIDSIAMLCETISYEIAVHFPSQLRRIIID